MDVPCFWVEKTDRQEWGLRRYCPSSTELCSDGSYHNALHLIGRRKRPPRPVSSSELSRLPAEVRARKDWPVACEACGRPFGEGDYFQVWTERIWRGPATGEEWSGRSLPPGALYDAYWMRGITDYEGPDGISLAVTLPEGVPSGRPWDARSHLWLADGPASSGGHWTRTGDPRNPSTLTVTPSIAKGTAGQPGYYHGWLRAGELVDA